MRREVEILREKWRFEKGDGYLRREVEISGGRRRFKEEVGD